MRFIVGNRRAQRRPRPAAGFDDPPVRASARAPPEDKYLVSPGAARFAFAMTVALMIFDYGDRQVIVSLFARALSDAIGLEAALTLTPIAALIAVFGFTRAAVTDASSDFSRWCLVAFIAGIGMKTQLKELVTVGIKPVLLMIGEIVLLVVLVLGMVRWMH